jgi:hypothetical protein
VGADSSRPKTIPSLGESSLMKENSTAETPEAESSEKVLEASIDSKFGAGTSAKLSRDAPVASKPASASAHTPAAAPSIEASSISHGAEPMIIVHVNDRLGTKAAVPAFASDIIEEFKERVAARIGRKPHELVLQRQGQKPFNDKITLADYEISNGVQLDLWVDTGE